MFVKKEMLGRILFAVPGLRGKGKAIRPVRLQPLTCDSKLVTT